MILHASTCRYGMVLKEALEVMLQRFRAQADTCAPASHAASGAA